MGFLETNESKKDYLITHKNVFKKNPQNDSGIVNLLIDLQVFVRYDQRFSRSAVRTFSLFGELCVPHEKTWLRLR